jgi:tyrosyl-tRNA synthetase
MKKEVEEGKVNPRDIKIKLAMYIVERFHSKEDAIKAKEYFERVVSKKEIPDNIPEPKVKTNNLDKQILLVDLIHQIGFAPSKSEARRLIKQGAVKINKEKIMDINYTADLNKEFILQVGKKKFARIKPENIEITG